MNALWQDLRLLVHELGPVAALLYGVDRLLRRMHPHSRLVYYRFLAQPVAAHARLPPRRGRQFAFRLLRGFDPALAALDRPREVLAQRFAQGAQCLLATREQALVGCIWFVRGLYREDEVRVDFVLPPDGRAVWDFDVYVAPPERLGLLFVKQWDALDALLHAQGVRHCISRINAFNRRSLASHRALGAQDSGWAIIVQLGAAQLVLAGVWPYVAWGGRPRLQLAPAGA